MSRSVTLSLLFCAIICIISDSLVRSSVGKFRSGSASLGASSLVDAEEVAKEYSENVMCTYGRYPLTIDYGSGCNLYTTDGKKYLDFAAGIATCCLGHANPALQKAVSDQMGKVNHVSNLYYIPEQGKLAKWLTTNSCADKVFFCNSGAEANEAAIKLARKNAHVNLGITHPVIITALQSFHGRTLTAITATGQAKYQKNFGPLTPGFEYVKYNDLEDLERMVKSIQEAGNGHGLAAIMMESLQGEGGIKPGEEAFFKGIRKICDATGAVMIMDEVQTGIGRTGKMWGYENLGVVPDVFTSAKALGGGVPIGCMCAIDKFNVFEPGDHASTYGGNPLACAAGLAVASAFDNDGLLENVQKRAAQFTELAAVLQEKYPSLIKEVRGWGLIRGIEITEESGISSANMAKALLDAGVLVVPAGPMVIRFVPPLVVSEEEMTEAMGKVDAAFQLLSNKH
jgi:acetylornithine/N-succinyldiaminopimelate aminotransferase